MSPVYLLIAIDVRKKREFAISIIIIAEFTVPKESVNIPLIFSESDLIYDSIRIISELGSECSRWGRGWAVWLSTMGCDKYCVLFHNRECPVLAVSIMKGWIHPEPVYATSHRIALHSIGFALHCIALHGCCIALHCIAWVLHCIASPCIA